MQLRTFEAVARHRSFMLAADELHITPSAVSHQIRHLEAHFGRELFERHHRRIELSPSGQRLFDQLSRLFDALDMACREVALPDGEQVLSLHCAPSFAVKWLGPRLADFRRRHPDISIRLTTGSDPVDLAAAREIDLWIAYGRPRQSPGIEVSDLGEESIVPLIAPALMPDARKPPALASLTLIESQLSSVTWAEWFTLNGWPPTQTAKLSFDRAALAISAAVDGMGMALESARLAERELRNGELKVWGGRRHQHLSRPMHFLHRRSRDRLRPEVAAFIEWLQRGTAQAH